MKNFLTLDDLDPQGKVLLLRADLNVPMQSGAVTDMSRITRLAPTIRELSTKGARTVILSHLGRPRGKDSQLTLAPVAAALSTVLGRDVGFAPDCIGPLAEEAVRGMKNGDVLLLENLRFYPEEENNDGAFAASLAMLGEVYVNDAFSCAHRAHASIHALAQKLPAYAGRLMEEELAALHKALDTPERPVMAVVGGAKISTKLALLGNLVQKVNTLVLGGGMANTFLAALDNPVGKSLCEREMKDEARDIMNKAKDAGCKIILPLDAIVATELSPNAFTRMIGIGAINDDEMMLDIGEDTISIVKKELKDTKTVLWNGPMGAFETRPFDHGTVALARAVAQLTSEGRLASIAGGGDTVAALAHAGVEEKMTYVSTAGGAFLEWLEGKDLPGVSILCAQAAKA